MGACRKPGSRVHQICFTCALTMSVQVWKHPHMALKMYFSGHERGQVEFQSGFLEDCCYHQSVGQPSLRVDGPEIQPRVWGLCWGRPLCVPRLRDTGFQMGYYLGSFFQFTGLDLWSGCSHVASSMYV